MRAFLAIDLIEDAVDALVRLQAMLPIGRPVPRDNLHLTLAFLGDQPEARLEALHYELEALQAPRFFVRVRGLGCFGGRSPKIVFADVAADPPLLDLQRQVQRTARRVGITLQRERYRPHVTLARLRPEPGAGTRMQRFLSDHSDFALPDMTVEAFALYRSTLRPGGARHEDLARYALR